MSYAYKGYLVTHLEAGPTSNQIRDDMRPLNDPYNKSYKKYSGTPPGRRYDTSPHAYYPAGGHTITPGADRSVNKYYPHYTQQGYYT